MNESMFTTSIHACLPGHHMLVMGLGWVLDINPEGLIMRLCGQEKWGPPCNTIHEREHPQTGASTSAQGQTGL